MIDRSSGQIRVADGATLDHESAASYLVTVTATDSLGATVEKSVTIAVDDVNDAPVAMDDSVSTDEDVAVEVDVLANDVDQDAGDSLTVRVVREPQCASVTVKGLFAFQVGVMVSSSAQLGLPA